MRLARTSDVPVSDESSALENSGPSRTLVCDLQAGIDRKACHQRIAGGDLDKRASFSRGIEFGHH